MRHLWITDKFTGAFVALALFFPFSPPQLISPPLQDPAISAATTDLDVRGTTAPETYGCGEVIVNPVNSDFEQQVVELVNVERANAGIPPLKRVASLDYAARYHSSDLGLDNYFSHDSYDRMGDELSFVCDPWTRIRTYYAGARGENIAGGFATPEAVVNAWMDSTTHRANILSPSSWEIGVGYFEGNGEYGNYWTQDFGRSSGIYPLIINQDTAETDMQQVSLYIYGSWSEVRIRNEGEDWSQWQPFQNNLPWELPNGQGEIKVSAEMRKEDQSAASSDTIFLSSAGATPYLGDLTDEISFTYFSASQRFVPESINLTPSNIGSSDILEWTLVPQGDWFSLSTSQGTTPDSFKITPLASGESTIESNSGGVTVTVMSPSGVINAPQTIELKLRVVSGEVRVVYIPFLLKPD